MATPSSVDGNLPYNWNWQRRWIELSDFLTANPIVLMDVGARGEQPTELESMATFVHRVGFEPDPAECQRLNASGKGQFFPHLVSDRPGTQTLNLYRDRGYSSMLTLTERFQRLWTGTVPVDRTIEAPTVTIDSFLAEHVDLQPDFLKLDTQGSELAILAGADRSLAHIGLVEAEVEFLPIYEGQPLFGNVAEFMHDHGFELLYLNRAFVSRRQMYQGPSRGQVVFGDALFGKREDRLDGLTPKQLAKHVVLLCQYGHIDIAHELVTERPDLDRIIPEIHQTFRTRHSRVARAAVMQLDKVLALALHMRRENQRGTDSDRCWPIR